MNDQQRARELQPCPFCGGEAKHTVWSDQNYNKVECEACDVDMDYFYEKADAFEAWNRRAALRAAPEGFVMVPEIATEEMLSAAYPRNERIDDAFDRHGAWADCIAARPQGVR